ncbi:MAG: hypothetical protein COV44_11290 [Deltaproteobacteria bacterium CG11_big_fil_rev_8_21_14_0_20_45_16]|nr:MAG: hypothetical protein COV44_11290 [Deltaproteobacteria bacterium CG11_big_fil_rev_8_21_14_0_20_45_16]
MFRKSLIVLILVIRPLFAQNYHEHLYMIPRVEDWAVEAGSEIRAAFASLRLSEVVYPKGLEKTVYREIFNIEPEQGERLTLLDLCLQLGRANFNKGLERLLSMPSDGDFSLAIRRELYLANSSIRYYLFHKLNTDGVSEVFSHYFKANPSHNGSLIDATAFFRDLEEWSWLVPNRRSRIKLAKVMLIARQHGIQIRYFAGFHREFLDEFQIGVPSALLDLEKSPDMDPKNGLINGIDITGSIFDDPYANDILFDDTAVERVLSALKTLASFCYMHELHLRLHAFEASAQAPFHEAVARLVEELKIPAIIRIGHAAALNPYWMSRLQAPLRAKVFVEMNPRSNENLFGTPIDQLRDIALELNRREIPLLVGADEIGIFENAAPDLNKARLQETCKIHFADLVLP